MIKAWPRSLIGRTVLVLLIGIVGSNVVGLAIYIGDRSDLIFKARGQKIAEQVVSVAELLEQTSIADRKRLAWSLRRPGNRLVWTTSPLVNNGPDSWRLRVVRRAFASELDTDHPDDLRLDFSPSPVRPFAKPNWQGDPSFLGDENDPRPFRGRIPSPQDAGVVIGALRLSDGSWLNFTAPFFAFRPFWTTRLFLVLLTTATVVLVVSIWAVRRATAPLSMFAEAAERLGLDMNAPSLAESGPIEVVRASRAFNRMQQRLRDFVNDRTHMLAAISHDLRTPLTRLRLRTEFVNDPDQRSRMLKDLYEMQEMLASTLAFAKDDATGEERREFDLAALLQTLCDDAEDSGANAEYRGPARARIAGRPMSMKRAFSNLIENAIRYGGRATVTLEINQAVGAAHPVKRTFAEKDSRDASNMTFIVRVEDEGVGLDDSELERVFEPFYRVEGSRSRNTGGVGLGLAVVRSVIVLHGGNVRLSNRAERGLCATVILPGSMGGTEVPNREETTPSFGHHRNAKLDLPQ